jgi:hypothetical protein
MNDKRQLNLRESPNVAAMAAAGWQCAIGRARLNEPIRLQDRFSGMTKRSELEN